MVSKETAAKRTILITGASTGIGRAAAKTLHARGWRVFATARQQEDLDALAALGVAPVALELADPESVAACADRVLGDSAGRLDALFNNAAYGQAGAIEDVDRTTMAAQFEVNVIGTHDLTQRIIPAMRAHGAGRIVNCSSVLGLVVGPFRCAYCATKFALEALSDAMRMELKGTGIEVALIEPGPIETNFVNRTLEVARATLPLQTSPHRARYDAMLQSLESGGKQTWKLPPDAVVEKLIHAVESARPKKRYYVTVPTHAAARLKRVLPTSAMDWLAARN
ncbi:MAG: SDR family NAD(P)-dependent oxidoreductase [Pseudomonadota bacterium]